MKLIIILTMLLFSSISYAELLWSPGEYSWQKTKQPSPAKNTKQPHTQHKSHMRPKEKAYYLLDQQNAEVIFIAPDLKQQKLSPAADSMKYTLPETGMDNYHALIAEKKDANSHASSLRYVSMRGKPSGISPSLLVQHNKLPLEIIPEPMIREHWKFYTSNSHSFSVLFNSQPLADNWVVMSTSNGTTLDGKTDQQGRIRFTLPEDFTDIKPGRRANKPAEFKLRTVHIANDITYQTNFNAPYYVNPAHWQSSSGGIAALSLGFISGLLLMFKHNHNNKPKNKNTPSSGKAS